MAKYILKSEFFEDDVFEADSEHEAEQYVERNYNEDDGPMTLYKAQGRGYRPIVSWP